MSIFSFAIKNLYRYKRRSLITSITVIVGIFSYMSMDSLVQGMIKATEVNLKKYEISYGQIMTKKFFENRDNIHVREAFYLETIGKQLDEIKIPWTRRIEFRAEATIYQDPYPEDGSISVRGYGIDLKKDSQVYEIKDHIKKGTYLTGISAGEVMIGSVLAKKMGADIGYPIIFSMKTKKGMHQVIDATIVGIFETPNAIVNHKHVFFPINEIDEYLQMEGEVNSIDIRVNELLELRTLDKIKNSLLFSQDDIAFYDWKIIGKKALDVSKGDIIGNYVMLFFLLLIVFIGVFSTMLMSISERYSEMGVLRALGMTNAHIIRLFIYEGLGIAIFGIIVGLFFGSIVVFYLTYVGIDFGNYMEYDMGYRISSIIHGAWSIKSIIFVCLVNIVTVMISSYIPVKKSLKVSITRSIHKDV